MIVALAFAGSARADPVEEAKAHYFLGAAAYGRDDFATAVREFSVAYQLSQKPEILFDIARAETKLGHEAAAIGHLKEYLKQKPDASDVSSVQGEIDGRERALVSARATDTANAEAERSKAKALEQMALARKAQDEARAAAHPRWPSAVLLGAGGVALIVGIVLGAMASHEASLVSAGAGSPSVFGGSAFADDELLGKNAFRAGVALDVIGGVLVVAGAGLLLWARHSSAPEPARAWRSPTGDGLSVRGAF